MFCEQLQKQILIYRMESAKYGEQIERGYDILESSRAQSYSDSAVEALTDALRQLEALRDTLQSTIERSATSDQELWDASVLS